MNWDLVATIAEVVAAIGVIASLIYVARQVRSAQSTAADTNRLTRASGAHEWLLTVAATDNLRDSVSKTYGLGPFHEEFAAEFDVSVEDAARTDYASA